MDGKLNGKFGEKGSIKVNCGNQNNQNRLRRGFSTGSTSAAAVKASIRYYFQSEKFSGIEIKMPGGENAFLKIAGLEKYKFCGNRNTVSKAAAVKDSGDDDFDVTGGIKIYADFTAINKKNKNDFRKLKKYYEKLFVYNIIKISEAEKKTALMLASSIGIGIAKRNGLPVKAGFPAINPVPYKMIEFAAEEELRLNMRNSGTLCNSDNIYLSVLYIPEGEKIAKKTLNPRLGIEGGISILGTTGYVIPVSTKAWLDTIKSSLEFLSENGINTCVYTPGRYSEKIAFKIIKGLPRECFIEIGDYVTYSVRHAVKSGIKNIILAGQFGKILKIAQGARNTNAKYCVLNLNFLEETVRKTLKNLDCGLEGSLEGGNGKSSGNIDYLCGLIASSNTSREAYCHITSDEFRIYSDIIFGETLKIAAKNLAKTAGEGVGIEIILISYDGAEIKRVTA